MKHIDRRSKPLCSTIYVKFDDSKAGNPLKDRRLPGELKECVPITAWQKTMRLYYANASKVNIIEVIEIRIVLEVLPIVLEIEEDTFLLVIVYRMPGLSSFIDDFILLFNPF